MARSIVLLDEVCLTPTIKRSSRWQHVIHENPVILVLPHCAFLPVELVDPAPGHASSHHQGAPSMLDCGHYSLWAVPLTRVLLYLKSYAMSGPEKIRSRGLRSHILS